MVRWAESIKRHNLRIVHY